MLFCCMAVPPIPMLTLALDSELLPPETADPVGLPALATGAEARGGEVAI